MARLLRPVNFDAIGGKWEFAAVTPANPLRLLYMVLSGSPHIDPATASIDPVSELLLKRRKNFSGFLRQLTIKLNDRGAFIELKWVMAEASVAVTLLRSRQPTPQ